MNKSDQPLEDIRSTGDEAKRWLEALESDQLPSPKKATPAEPITQSYTEWPTERAKNQANPALVLLILAALFSPLILLAVYQSGGGRTSSVSSSNSLGYSASCGSSSSSSGRWWPVLGGADGSLLNSVRSRYCGDAYINTQGVLQVASFGTWEEADAFRIRIEEATGRTFRVGQGTVPGG